jgi:hypothetical protein
MPHSDTFDLFSEFVSHHGLVRSPALEFEQKAIHWTCAGNLLVNEGYSTLGDEKLASNAAVGVILTLLHRAFEHLSAAIIAFVTGSGSTSEGVSRVVTELSVSITYMLQGQPESRLLAFFDSYVESEKKRLRTWAEAAKTLPRPEAHEHLESVRHRKGAIDAMEALVLRLRSECSLLGIPIARETWPSVADRFSKIGDVTGYRTFYGRMSGQIHSDAEETLRYFLGKVQGDPENFARMALETVVFSRFLLYAGVRYFLSASLEYARRYGMNGTDSLLERGIEVINEELVELARQVDDRQRA